MSGYDPTIPSGQPGDDSDPAPPPGAPKIPGVRVHREIGKGGMGVVFEGQQEFLERRVAVKVVSARLTTVEFSERFRREAQILAELNHPNIVTCYDSGVTEDGQCFMVMEYVDGPGTLTQWTESRGPISGKLAIDICRRLADALDHAWQAGIIHRDVKPDNVLVERGDPSTSSTVARGHFSLSPKLIDLGIARAVDHDQLTQAGGVVGTMSTMAPEQIEYPDEVDFRADIYGLGCVIYHALTGEAAFSGPASAILERKRNQIPDPRKDRDVSDGLAELVQSMIAYDRDERPQTYAEIIETCDELCGDTTTLTRRFAAPAAESAPAQGRRSFLWGGLAVAVLAAAAVFIVPMLGEDPRQEPQQDPQRGGAANSQKVSFEVVDRPLEGVLTDQDERGDAFLFPGDGDETGFRPASFAQRSKSDMGWFVESDDGCVCNHMGDDWLEPTAEKHWGELERGHELIARVLIRPATWKRPHLSGLLLQLADRDPLFVGFETRADETADKGYRCRGVVAPYPGREEVRRRDGSDVEWVLNPVAGSMGEQAVLGVMETVERPLYDYGDNGEVRARLLMVRVALDGGKLAIDFGDHGEPEAGKRVLLELPAAAAVRVAPIVVLGKTYFHHVCIRKIPR